MRRSTSSSSISSSLWFPTILILNGARKNSRIIKTTSTIHRAAGPQLVEACRTVPEIRPGVRCPTGEARITPGFMLPASHVIHTVGPIYSADINPAASLASAYRNTLMVAKENNIQYIAFPAISCGVYGYPYDEAATVAISTIKEFPNDFKEVHFVLFSPDIYDIWSNKVEELLKD
ncbi:Macro domain-containing protein XCC3184 [Glycine soja]